MSFASGIVGRVRKGGTALTFLGKWTLSKQTAKIVTPVFESPVDADGNVYPRLLRGLSSAMGTAGGFFDTGAGAPDSVAVGLSNGLFVTLDLLIDRGAPWGVFGLPVFIDQIDLGSDVNNQGAPFAMNFTVDGIAPKTAAA